MRQFQMLDEAGGLDVVAMGDDEFLVLGRRDDILAEAKKAAALRVRAQFVLSRIAEELKLEVTREELGAAIMQAAQASQTQPEKLVKDRQRLAELRRDALLNKALDAVLAGGIAA